MTNEKAHTNNVDMKVKCHCGKVCKNFKGLKIHQARTKCGDVATPEKHRVAAPCEMQEILNQEAPQSTEDLCCNDLTPEPHNGTL